MAAADGSVTPRRMTAHDLPMLLEWLNRLHVLEWWGGGHHGPSLAEISEEFGPTSMVAARVTPYIALLDVRPIGYAQSYVALGSGDGWWEDATDSGVRGIDQSPADAALLGRGLRTQLVKALADLLFSDPVVTHALASRSQSSAAYPRTSLRQRLAVSVNASRRAALPAAVSTSARRSGSHPHRLREPAPPRSAPPHPQHDGAPPFSGVQPQRARPRLRRSIR